MGMVPSLEMPLDIAIDYGILTDYFGVAFYTTLKYYSAGDNLWPVEKHTRVVINNKEIKGLNIGMNKTLKGIDLVLVVFPKYESELKMKIEPVR